MAIACSTAKIVNIAIKQIGALSEINAVNIEKGNVMFDHCDISSIGANCIQTSGETQLTLLNCKVHKGKQYGVWLTEKSSGLFENNVCYNYTNYKDR